MDDERLIANYHEQMIDEKKERLLRADLDEASCCICGEIDLKANMEWLKNDAGEQGWCCKDCEEGEQS